MRINWTADKLGAVLLPGIRELIFSKIEEKITKEAEKMVREAINEACQLTVGRLESMENFGDRDITLVLNIGLNNGQREQTRFSGTGKP